MDKNKDFNSVCKVVLGQEIGTFAEFEKFLTRYVNPVKKAKSVVSGKEVYYADPFCPKAKFVSLEEIDKVKVEPLKQDELKDIDSLLGAVQERFHYCGNKIIGKHEDVVESENCNDAYYIYRSQKIYNCQNLAYCEMIWDSKYMFGCAWGTINNFCINTVEMYRVNRTFESALVINTSDAYYSYNCNNCNEVMFCFNQRSKRHCIGNVELERTKYMELKKKLLGEMVEKLKKDKTVPGLVDFCLGGWI